MVWGALLAIVVLILIVWRFVFTGLGRSLFRAIVVPQQQRYNLLAQGRHILGRADLSLIGGIPLENGSDGGNAIATEERAKTHLRRIVALTGAKQTGSCYVLQVGKTRFYVRDRYVKRIPDGADPTWARWETCFHPARQGMPEAEQIATVLLQLKNNPALFDSWALKPEQGFKADGRVFRRVQ